MADRLKDKVAIVTGGTRGIGAAITAGYLAEGACVLFTGRDVARGEALQAELGERSLFRAVDVAKEDEIEAMVDAAVDHFGGLDCLVSNAGGGIPTGSVTDLDAEKFWYSMHVHVGSVVYGMKHAPKHMARRGGGSIINIASIAAHGGAMSGYSYSGAKAAVVHLSRCAALHLSPDRVRVNSISPGPILTTLFSRAQGLDVDSLDNEARAKRLAAVFEEITPLHIAGMPDDITPAAIYFASDESRYVTGQDLVIDGGVLNGGPLEDFNSFWAKIAEAAR